MRIETKRLLLREVNDSDALCMYNLAENPNIGPKAGWLPHQNIEETKALITKFKQKPNFFVICLKNKPDELIGCIELKSSPCDLTQKLDESEIGYWLGEAYWGNGYMGEAVNAILEYGFNTLNLNAIWCGYYEGNNQSKRVQEKCGFIYHHTTNNLYLEKFNEYRNGIANILTKEDYLNKQKMIAYCGLDCSMCEAYLATINNDEALRQIVSEKWSKLNNCLITKEMINCYGCKSDKPKTYFCEMMCEIRRCAINKNIEKCNKCSEKINCQKIIDFESKNNLF